MESLESAEDAVQEFGLHARTVVPHGECAFEIRFSAGDVHSRRGGVAVLDSVANEVRYYPGQCSGVAVDWSERVTGNHCAVFRNLLADTEQSQLKGSLHLSPRGLLNVRTRRPVIHDIGEERLHFRRAGADAFQELLIIGIETAHIGFGHEFAKRGNLAERLAQVVSRHADKLFEAGVGAIQLALKVDRSAPFLAERVT